MTEPGIKKSEPDRLHFQWSPWMLSPLLFFVPKKIKHQLLALEIPFDGSLAIIQPKKFLQFMPLAFAQVMLPIIVSTLTLVILNGIPADSFRYLLTILLPIAWGIAAAVLVNIPTGTLISIALAPISAYFIGNSDVGLHDLFLGNFLPIFWGVWIGIVGYISTIDIELNTFAKPQDRRYGLVVGVFSTFSIILVLYLNSRLVTPFWNANRLTGFGIGLILTIQTAVFIFLPLYGRGLNLAGSLKGAAIIGLTLGGLTALYFNSTGYEDDLIGINLLGVVLTIITAFYLLFFGYSYCFGRRFAGAFLGNLIAMISSGAIFYAVYFTFAPFQENIRLKILIFIGLSLSGLTLRWWRPVLSYLPQVLWQVLLLQRLQFNALPPIDAWKMHPLRWDEMQWIPLWDFDRFLKLIAEADPATFNIILNEPSLSTQNWAVRNTFVQMDAEKLSTTKTIQDISNIRSDIGLTRSDHSTSLILQNFKSISQDVNAALSQSSTYNQRLALLKISGQVNILHKELLQTNERFASLFRSIAFNWQEIIVNHEKQLSTQLARKQEIQNPYVIGVPLSLHQEIFVGRKDISLRLENLILDAQHPPLLLYGQRRMGKTSLLNNLASLLPSTIIPLFVDLQGPVSLASSNSGFLYNLSRQIVSSAKKTRQLDLPKLAKDELTGDPFTVFDQWLDKIEEVAVNHASTLLIALDEFEVLHDALSREMLDERAILGFLRHTIQHRPQIKILLAGSHTIEEFERWASYFINAQVIHLSYLNLEESIQLVQHPVANFELSYQSQALEKILELTNGHPYLIQLLCHEIVLLKNKQDIEVRLTATTEDVQQAAKNALESGRLFFADIERNQLDSDSVDFLKWVSTELSENNFTVKGLETRDFLNLPKILKELKDKELIHLSNGSYSFQAKLILMWFRRSS